jgi:2-dehydro-3-deoxyphosphooctonate aldolase (KDO 8-P synthase)
MQEKVFKDVTVGVTCFSNPLPLKLIIGPCLLESRSLALEVAQEVASICQELGISWVFKASFDKANRTSLAGKRQGVSLNQALKIFAEIKEQFGCPVVTDVHDPAQCVEVAQHVDLLQIPAFLCRQTDLITAAAATQKPIMIKKGQFLSPAEMLQVGEKAQSLGAVGVMLCERGTTFGYHKLVNDMTGLATMAGFPVVFDATHSVQLPGALNGKSSGESWFVECVARAATAIGVAGIFMETHPDPSQAFSDGPNMVPLAFLKGLVKTLKEIDHMTKKLSYQGFSLPAF